MIIPDSAKDVGIELSNMLRYSSIACRIMVTPYYGVQ